VVEATVQRARPVILTALAAVLAFVPLIKSVFWGSMAITLIGGTLGGTVLTLVFCPRSTPCGSASVSGASRPGAAPMALAA
jgi:multidrug efflux pump subunit AcrB